MPKHDSKSPNNVEKMLREDVFMTLRINSMNFNSLLANEDVDMYYEITLQLFYGDSKPLSNKTMIPLIKSRESQMEPISRTFLQIPM